MTLELPSINIAFKTQATTAYVRGNRGIVALIVKETTSTIKSVTIYDKTDIPNSLSDTNKDYIEKALIGNTKAPLKLELYIIAGTLKIDDALTYFENVKFDYLAYPAAETTDVTAIETFISTMRDTNGIKVKAVLANAKADSEGIINVTQDDVVVGSTTYDAEDLTARVAGLLAGTDLKISTTYSTLPEVDSIPQEKRSATKTKVGNGEFVLMKDTNEIVVARGVNSLTTTSNDKGEAFQKIKIVDVMDLISNDLRETVRKYYIGKYANSYDNKCLLMTAIRAYLEGLASDDLVQADTINVDINLEKQKTYLKQQGVDISNMSETDIKEYNTADKVFILVNCKILDAIEDVDIQFVI